MHSQLHIAAFEEQAREKLIKVRCGDFNLQYSDDDRDVQVGEVAHYDIHDWDEPYFELLPPNLSLIHPPTRENLFPDQLLLINVKNSNKCLQFF